MAPENFDIGETSDSTNLNASISTISPKVDVWAFGCITHELFSGYRPWSNCVKSENQLIGKLFSKTPFPIEESRITNIGILNIIKYCTNTDVSSRCSINQVKELLYSLLFQCVKTKDFLNIKFDSKKQGKFNWLKLFNY
jgi:serine/threonine protein kinase